MKSLWLSPLLVVIVACGSTSPSEDVGPAPTDAVVYDASAETQKDLGIAKWGYTETDDVTTFRGYDAKNARLVEVTQQLDETTDDFTKRLTLTMTGKLGTASAKIDLGVIVSDDYQTTNYSQDTIENTFAGGIGEKVLAHLGPDSDAMAKKAIATDTSGTLLNAKTLHPQDDAPTTSTPSTPAQSTPVTPGGALTQQPTELLMCCADLNTAQVGLGGQVGMSCALQSGGQSRILGGQTIRPEAIARGANGRLAVVSPWSGPYNIVDHHCHNAAASNSSATDGYIGCDATSSTTSYSGHTINWAPNPYQSANNFCAYEPQANGGTISGGSICCFHSTAGADGAPALSGHDAQACVTQLCLGQANYTGAAGSTPPRAFPAGSTPQTPNDCPSSSSTLISCNTCCSGLADSIAGHFPQPEFATQVADYRKRCAANCTQADTVRNPPAPTPTRTNTCTPSVLQWLQSRLQRQSTCGGR